MLREKNLLAHTEHSSMEFLRADSVPNQHAHVPRASVAKIHGNTCLWALTLMKRNQNLVETQKAATRARRLAVVSCPTQGRKNHGVSGVFTVPSWWSRSIIRAAMQPERSILRAK